MKNDTEAQTTNNQVEDNVIDGETEVVQASDNNDEEDFPLEIDAIMLNDVDALGGELWARMEGNTYADRQEIANALIKSIREARDSDKKKRVVRTLEEILNEAIGLPLADLQTVKVEVEGVSLPIPQIINAARNKENTGFKKMALKFLNQNDLWYQERKVKSSKGKATTFLVRKSTLPPEEPAKEAA